MNSRFQNALARKPQAVPPIWFMRQAGRYHKHYQALRAKHSFVELCKNPELAAETALGPMRDFDFDVSILFSDLLFPLEALGMGLTYDPSPKLGFSLSEETFSRLKPWADGCADLSFQGDAVKATRALLPKDKSLIGFVGGPWTLFVYAVEGGHSGSLIKSKQGLASLFPRFCESILPLLQYTIARQLEGGAELVMVFDTAAGELSPALYEKYVSPSLAKMAQFFPGKLGYYGKGLTEDHLRTPTLQKTAFAGMGIDHRFVLPRVLSTWEKGFLQGNFDQALLHLAPADFENALREYLAPFKALSVEQRTGWVSALGHGVLPATPERNVKRMVEIIRETFA